MVYWLMVCSRCLGHQPSELQVGNLPAFLQHFTEARPLLVSPPRNSESILSSVRQTKTKMAAPVKRFIFFVFVPLGHFNVDLKYSYTLDYIAALFRSPIYALHGLAVQYNVKLCCLFLSWFAKEANVANTPLAAEQVVFPNQALFVCSLGL